jgi:hypothetical protein
MIALHYALWTLVCGTVGASLWRLPWLLVFQQVINLLHQLHCLVPSIWIPRGLHLFLEFSSSVNESLRVPVVISRRFTFVVQVWRCVNRVPGLESLLIDNLLKCLLFNLGFADLFGDGCVEWDILWVHCHGVVIGFADLIF